MTACIWARKSSSVRVGSAWGATIFPVTTSRLRMKARVPCRVSSNLRRSTFPGASGNPGCLRESRLHPGQLIRADRPFAFFDEFGSLPIDLTDRPMVVSRCGSTGGVNQERIKCGQGSWEIPFCKRRAVWRGEMCSIIPRAITSSAISRPVQWRMGRSLGCSQDNAIS
jgi:hypothetical protein